MLAPDKWRADAEFSFHRAGLPAQRSQGDVNNPGLNEAFTSRKFIRSNGQNHTNLESTYL